MQTARGSHPHEPIHGFAARIAPLIRSLAECPILATARVGDGLSSVVARSPRTLQRVRDIAVTTMPAE